MASPLETPPAARWALFLSVGAFCVSVATSLLVLVFTINHDRELAARDLEHAKTLERLRARSESAHAAAPAMGADLAAIKNWMIAVYERADAHGWGLPPLPKEVRDGRTQEAPVQPPGGRGRRDGRH